MLVLAIRGWFGRYVDCTTSCTHRPIATLCVSTSVLCYTCHPSPPPHSAHSNPSRRFRPLPPYLLLLLAPPYLLIHPTPALPAYSTYPRPTWLDNIPPPTLLIMLPQHYPLLHPHPALPSLGEPRFRAQHQESLKYVLCGMTK